MKKLPEFNVVSLFVIVLLFVGFIMIAVPFSEFYKLQPGTRIVYFETFNTSIHIINSSLADDYNGYLDNIPLEDFMKKHPKYIAVGYSYVSSSFCLFGGASSKKVQYMTEIPPSRIYPSIPKRPRILLAPIYTYLENHTTPLVKGNKLYFKIEINKNIKDFLLAMLASILMFIICILYLIYVLITRVLRNNPLNRKDKQARIKEALKVFAVIILTLLFMYFSWSPIFYGSGGCVIILGIYLILFILITVKLKTSNKQKESYKPNLC